MLNPRIREPPNPIQDSCANPRICTPNIITFLFNRSPPNPRIPSSHPHCKSCVTSWKATSPCVCVHSISTRSHYLPVPPVGHHSAMAAAPTSTRLADNVWLADAIQLLDLCRKSWWRNARTNASVRGALIGRYGLLSTRHSVISVHHSLTYVRSCALL